MQLIIRNSSSVGYMEVAVELSDFLSGSKDFTQKVKFQFSENSAKEVEEFNSLINSHSTIKNLTISCEQMHLVDEPELLFVALRTHVGINVKSLQMTFWNVGAQNYFRILSKIPNVAVIEAINCVITNYNQEDTNMDLPQLSELRLKECDPLMLSIVFAKVSKLKLLEVHIDEGWNSKDVAFLVKFIGQQSKFLKLLRIFGSASRSALFNKTNARLELNSLVLDGVLLGKEGEPLIASQTQMESVELALEKGKANPRQIIVDVINNNKLLKELKLKLANISVAVSGELQRNKSVKSLTFNEQDHSKFQPQFFLTLIPALPNLTHLELTCTGWYEKDSDLCDAMSRLAFLESLALNNIEQLALFDLQIKSQSLAAVKLEVICGDGDEVDEESLKMFLKRHPQIADLEVGLPPMKVNPPLCQFIVETLPGLKKISVVVFEHVEECLDILKASIALKDLKMRLCHFQDLPKDYQKDLKDSKLSISFHALPLP